MSISTDDPLQFHFTKVSSIHNMYITIVKSSIRNKEEKRVSNVLYALCKMFSESHTPGIQTLTNEKTRFNYLIVGMALSASKQVCDIE